MQKLTSELKSVLYQNGAALVGPFGEGGRA